MVQGWLLDCSNGGDESGSGGVRGRLVDGVRQGPRGCITSGVSQRVYLWACRYALVEGDRGPDGVLDHCWCVVSVL